MSHIEKYLKYRKKINDLDILLTGGSRSTAETYFLVNLKKNFRVVMDILFNDKMKKIIEFQDMLTEKYDDKYMEQYKQIFDQICTYVGSDFVVTNEFNRKIINRSLDYKCTCLFLHYSFLNKC